MKNINGGNNFLNKNHLPQSYPKYEQEEYEDSP